MAATNPSPTGPNGPVTTVTTATLGTTPTAVPVDDPGELYPDGIPDPKGTDPVQQERAEEGESTDPTAGVGVDGEIIVWEARYSMRNFIGRTIYRGIATVAWVVLAVYTWGYNHQKIAPLTWILGALILLFWIGMALRMVQARYSHYYRLTNRRLFVSTGIMNRRRDMMELLRVKDVFTRQQSLLDRWVGMGTVVVVPSEKELPTFYLTGVDDPKLVMDLIWHQARAERDQRSVKVDKI